MERICKCFISTSKWWRYDANFDVVCSEPYSHSYSWVASEIGPYQHEYTFSSRKFVSAAPDLDVTSNFKAMKKLIIGNQEVGSKWGNAFESNRIIGLFANGQEKNVKVVYWKLGSQ